ncbi:hypothetical protein L2E82_32513 [Cichorium intybus]|uniref:Uncharacterized protein n=1 Tax=Cichorium intybus TaxID=13427 RepID=A0ACB9BHQ5_CICIN|nr:hypothetical protein L2E82_32513 [Cichorium intybus]
MINIVLDKYASVPLDLHKAQSKSVVGRALTDPFLFSGLSIRIVYSLHKSPYLNLVSLHFPAMFFDSDHRLSILKFM